MANDPGESALPLAYAEQPNPPKRPSRYDEKVKLAAAELLLPDIIDWLGEDWRDSEREMYIADLMRVVNKWDGYEAARELERCHWSANADLVALLDGGTYLYQAEEQAIKAWVIANQITPKLAPGDRVSTKHGEGEIVSTYIETATHVVQTIEYLRDHPKQEGKGGGYVLPYEAVTPASTASLPETPEA